VKRDTRRLRVIGRCRKRASWGSCRTCAWSVAVQRQKPLSDAGGQRVRIAQLTWPARVRSSDFVGRHLFGRLCWPNPKWRAGRILTVSRSTTTAQSVVEHGLYGSSSVLSTTPFVLMQSKFACTHSPGERALRGPRNVKLLPDAPRSSSETRYVFRDKSGNTRTLSTSWMSLGGLGMGEWSFPRSCINLYLTMAAILFGSDALDRSKRLQCMSVICPSTKDAVEPSGR